MEEVSRTKASNSQPLLSSLRPPMLAAAEMNVNRPNHADCTAEEPGIMSLSPTSTSASEERCRPVMHDEDSQKSFRSVKKETDRDIMRRHSSCHKRRIQNCRGMRMFRSTHTTRSHLASTAAREAFRTLALAELGVLDRAAARLTEWMQVITYLPKHVCKYALYVKTHHVL